MGWSIYADIGICQGLDPSAGIVARRGDTARVLDDYATFFAASSGASAAFIGLLFVALTIANQEDRDEQTRARRDALAGASFAQLLDAFFVSIVSLTGDTHVFAGASVVMAGVGLWATSQLLPRVIRTGNWSRAAPHRKRNIALPVVSILVYVLQLGTAAALLVVPHSSVLQRIAVLMMLGLYAGALARSWEITQT
jgi:hypothetical protein